MVGGYRGGGERVYCLSIYIIIVYRRSFVSRKNIQNGILKRDIPHCTAIFGRFVQNA